jgi:hypothetical protein
MNRTYSRPSSQVRANTSRSYIPSLSHSCHDFSLLIRPDRDLSSTYFRSTSGTIFQFDRDQSKFVILYWNSGPGRGSPFTYKSSKENIYSVMSLSCYTKPAKKPTDETSLDERRYNSSL